MSPVLQKFGYSAIVASLLLFSIPFAALAAEPEAGGASDEAPLTAEQQAYLDKLKALNWVKGPTSVAVAGNSELAIPEGYLYLDQSGTSRYLELNQNMSSGKEIMVAPTSMEWQAYLTFEAEGYVKDDEKIDADQLLHDLQAGQQEANKERRRRGWSELTIKSWARPPSYNQGTHRLEWATLIESDGSTGTNFFTKVLGRRGHTSVQMVADVESLAQAEAKLDDVLNGYTFNSGERYSEWVPGDKVAEYGLAAMVLGGAAAVAAKKGLFGVIAGFLAAAWKLVVAGAVALVTAVRSFFAKKKT
ncbi:MAG TPA: DUF2167 domain-containing protein [Steroidobacteraceae bacterium]|jgi:uncharacterized membrane-anchored protein